MGVFYHDDPPNHPKRSCKCLVATLKEVLFSRCQTFAARLSTSGFEHEYPISDFDEEQEVYISAVISRSMEKQKQKGSVLRHRFSWVYSPATKEVVYASEAKEKVVGEGGDEEEEEEEEEEEFLSVKSCLTQCSSGEAFYSVKTNLSRCSSLKEHLDLSEYWRRSVIKEFCHCEGWPFGLCRRAVLLPPLPKSPSDSWLSRQIQPTTKKPSKLFRH